MGGIPRVKLNSAKQELHSIDLECGKDCLLRSKRDFLLLYQKVCKPYMGIFPARQAEVTDLLNWHKTSFLMVLFMSW